jgi:hypothetical protein
LDVKGTLRLSGSTSGYVGFTPAAAAGSTIYTLPSSDGTNGQQLSTNGSGNLIWSNQTGTITNALSSSANVITSTVNGIATTANAVNSVSNTSSTNSLTTTVNGVSGTAVNIINTNSSSLSGANLTTTVNGVASTALDLTPAITSKAWSLTGNSGITSVTNFIGTTDSKSLRFRTNNIERMIIDSIGNIGMGITTPTALLQLKGGTAAASTAPLKFTAGTNLTAPENGAVEYNGTHLYITIGGTRYQLDQQNLLKANYQSTPADPAGTTSTAGVMAGLAGSITPGFSGRVLIIISGDIGNPSANAGGNLQIRYGTGGNPANGAALTGTAVGGQISEISNSGVNRMPFSCNAIVSGLTIGTTYWVDIGQANYNSSGTVTITSVSISIMEL